MRRTSARPVRSSGLQASFMKLKPYERVLVVAAVVLVVATVFLFQGYRQARASKDKASTQLSGVERGINSLKRDFDVGALEKKKANLAQELASGQNPWGRNYESLDVDNLVTTSAVQSRVEVVRLNLGKDSKKKLGNVEYQVELRQVQVKGDLANIVRFIDRIERGQFPTLRMNNIKVSLVKGTWSGSFDIELWSLVEDGAADGGRKGQS